MSEPKVNDGKGLWDNEGVCEKAIVLCNDAIKQLMNGEYLNFCNEIYQVAKILSNLKTGISHDRKSYEAKIEDLKRINETLEKQLTGLPVIKDGADNGNNSD